MIGGKEYRIKDIVDFPPKVKITKGEEVSFVEMDNLTPHVRFVQHQKLKRFESGGGAKFQDKDVLFARITPCLQNRKISQANIGEGKVGFGSTEFFVFRAKEKLLDQTYLYYLSTTYQFVESAINSMVGASGRQRADKGYVENIRLKIPPSQNPTTHSRHPLCLR